MIFLTLIALNLRALVTGPQLECADWYLPQYRRGLGLRSMAPYPISTI